MAVQIVHRRNETTGTAPTVTSLQFGEFAVNGADGNAFLKSLAYPTAGTTANGIPWCDNDYGYYQFYYTTDWPGCGGNLYNGWVFWVHPDGISAFAPGSSPGGPPPSGGWLKQSDLCSELKLSV